MNGKEDPHSWMRKIMKNYEGDGRDWARWRRGMKRNFGALSLMAAPILIGAAIGVPVGYFLIPATLKAVLSVVSVLTVLFFAAAYFGKRNGFGIDLGALLFWGLSLGGCGLIISAFLVSENYETVRQFVVWFVSGRI